MQAELDVYSEDLCEEFFPVRATVKVEVRDPACKGAKELLPRSVAGFNNSVQKPEFSCCQVCFPLEPRARVL